MPHRDPQTGKFVSTPQFEDTETVPFTVSLHFDGHTQNVDVNEWARTSTWEGLEILDLDELLDRHRVATLVDIDAALNVAAYQSGGDFNSFIVVTEISASPALQVADVAPEPDLEPVDDQEEVSGDLDDIRAEVVIADTVDLPVRPLVGTSGSPFNDETDTAGGASLTGEVDHVRGPVPGDWDFDRRDELFLNGTVGTDGAFAGSGWATVTGIMTFAVVED